MKLVFTRTASRSLERIAIQIEKDNPRAAEKFGALVRTKTQELVDFPLSCPAVPRYGDGVRMMMVGRYLILYRVAEDRIVIRQIVHGARDVARLLTRSTI